LRRSRHRVHACSRRRAGQGGDRLRAQPYGDNFLSPRSGPGTGFPELRRLGPSTYVVVLGYRGPWRLVRLLDGVQGWVHGRWLC